MGRAMGSVLLDASLKALSDAGFTNVLLWVLEDNLRARKFYEDPDLSIAARLLTMK